MNHLQDTQTMKFNDHSAYMQHTFSSGIALTVTVGAAPRWPQTAFSCISTIETSTTGGLLAWSAFLTSILITLEECQVGTLDKVREWSHIL